MIVQELPQAECIELLDANRVARLACARGNQPYIVPLFYAYADGSAYSFTMPGQKLDIMRANPKVAFLVEEKGEGRCWKSVLAEGRFEEFPDRIGQKRQREHAWSLLSAHANWWEPGALKPVMPRLAAQSSHVFFCVHVERMSGREAIEE